VNPKNIYLHFLLKMTCPIAPVSYVFLCLMYQCGYVERHDTGLNCHSESIEWHCLV
jgi:hypothetical protein